MKSYTYILLALLLLITSACSRNKKDNDASIDPTPTLTGGADTGYVDSLSGSVPIRVMVPGSASKSDPIAETLATQFRMAITVVPYPSDYEEMMAVLAAADSRPDVFLLALNPARMYRLVREGTIRGIPDAMLDNFPLLKKIIEQDPISQANNRIYGTVGYIPCVYDIDPVYTAEAGRFLYRKDWAGILNLRSFATTDDLYQAAHAFAGEANPNRPDEPLIGLTVDKPDRFAYMYGIDPAGWLMEDQRYVPAFYSDRMIQPLTYARRLYAEGLLVFSQGGITLNDTGILIAKAGTPQDLSNLLTPVAQLNRTSIEDVLTHHVEVIHPPHAPGVANLWGRTYRSEAWLAREGLPDGILYRFMEMLDHSLSQEGRDYARYGLLDETYAREDAHVHLYTDPITYRAYDLADMFPAGQFLLGLMTWDASRETDLFYPSGIPLAIRTAYRQTTARYYYPIDGPDALGRAAHSPAKDNLSIDYNAYFYNIITGEEPVGEMFSRYKKECVRHGVEDAIAEVNRVIGRFY